MNRHSRVQVVDVKERLLSHKEDFAAPHPCSNSEYPLGVPVPLLKTPALQYTRGSQTLARTLYLPVTQNVVYCLGSSALWCTSLPLYIKSHSRKLYIYCLISHHRCKRVGKINFPYK